MSANTMHVVMAGGHSPIYVVIPSPVAVFDKKSDADKYAEYKNKRATHNEYYVRKVKKEPTE